MVHVRARNRTNNEAGWLEHITQPGFGVTVYSKRAHPESVGAQRASGWEGAGDRTRRWSHCRRC
ncbi:hypothetical protein T492DRAFT_1046939 [Pavlovales sp. CCMP2436]|nr:hypothetical protein T492DRAFT_1046939 [Pavlovales sp. CCMP2436]